MTGARAQDWKPTLSENPRGYAFVSFVRSYNKVLTWPWGAAAKVHGHMLDRTEWIENGLRMYDRWTGGDDRDYRQATATIIEHMSNQVRTDHIGLIGTRRTPQGTVCYPKYRAWAQGDKVRSGSVLAGHLPDQDDWINRETLRDNLKLLRRRLTGDQYDLLSEFMFGQHDSVMSAAHELGFDQVTYDRARRGYDINRWELEI